MPVLGQVTIRANGKQMKTKAGATLNVGGWKNVPHPKPGGGSWGSSRVYVTPTLQLVLVAAEDVDVKEINDMQDVTIVWEGDNGIDYMITKCNPQDPFVLNDSGEITGTFEGDKSERV